MSEIKYLKLGLKVFGRNTIIFMLAIVFCYAIGRMAWLFFPSFFCHPLECHSFNQMGTLKVTIYFVLCGISIAVFLPLVAFLLFFFLFMFKECLILAGKVEEIRIEGEKIRYEDADCVENAGDWLDKKE